MTKLIHHNWWNFYERGCDLMARGDTANARLDFERCIGVRPGATYAMPEDLRRARTYGLHFVEQYFPHRELGVSCYLLGETTQAVHWLNLSLGQTPSGRAKFYLNLARKRLLEGQTAEAPRIHFDAASGEPWTRSRRRDLSGSAAGPGFVSEIRVNGHPQFIELAATNMPFSHGVQLTEGSNVLRVTVSDLAGHSVETSLTWIADWRPPELIIRKATRSGNEWHIEGRCTDDRDLLHVTIRNLTRPGVIVDEKNPPGDAALDFRFAIGDTLALEAVDAAGNTLETTIEGDRFATLPAEPRCYAAVPAEGVADAPAATGGKTADSAGPAISLDAQGAIRIFNDEFVIHGTVSDPGGLESVRIGHDEALVTADRGAVTYSFTRRIPLALGTNRVTIAARDLTGKTTQRDVTVIRKQPTHLDLNYRLALVMPPFIAGAGRPASLADTIRRRAGVELASDPQRFFVVERDEGWDLLLREQELSISDLADPRTVLELGKVLPAELFLVGSVFSHGTGTTIYATIADAETGETLAADDVYSESLDADINDKVAGLIMKLEQRFPLVEGRITGVRRSQATVDVGVDNGVMNGMKFLVVHPASGTAPIEEGDVCLASNRLVELRVKNVDAGTGTADIRPDEARGLIRSGDYIYAR